MSVSRVVLHMSMSVEPSWIGMAPWPEYSQMSVSIRGVILSPWGCHSWDFCARTILECTGHLLPTNSFHAQIISSAEVELASLALTYKSPYWSVSVSLGVTCFIAKNTARGQLIVRNTQCYRLVDGCSVPLDFLICDYLQTSVILWSIEGPKAVIDL